MEYVYWTIIIILFAIAFIGLFLPIIPSVLFIIGGFVVYGLSYSFEPFGWLFWLVQGMFVLLLFGADYAANMIGIRKYGGSKAGIWGSTIGILAGPFVIPVLGILIGPFIGAIAAEMIVHKKDIKEAAKIGMGSVVGFVSSIAAKGFIQTVMIVYFLFLVL
ncbi:DUF456 domain-containing protein [Bacillus infantis]|uniref:DUF456 domain-containing protein n=1 Tax=Bacillus infantis TaxID=324767 RepID=A0A5D4R0Q3_9BACI|nr:DUF456 domain-containing protein [Bacillus infantis]TYS44279.1 DUF456 domain-containing protein [Bacillus infantis]